MIGKKNRLAYENVSLTCWGRGHEKRGTWLVYVIALWLWFTKYINWYNNTNINWIWR